MTDHRPPRTVSRILEWVLPPTDHASAILGDLEEEFRSRAASSLPAARRWYVREAVGIGLRYARRRRRYDRRRLAPHGRSTRRWEGMMDAVLMNLRYAVRRLRRSPLFTAVAIVSLGLGIGANTAMFSLVNATIIRDVPYDRPEELVDLFEATEGFSHGTLSYPDYLDLQEATEGVFAEVAGSQVAFVQGDGAEGVEGLLGEAVTGNYFETVGIDAAMGRMIGPEDHVDRGAHPVVVLAWDYWQTRFAGDPSIVGREIRLSGRPYTVIGIAPEAYTGALRGLEPSVFLPIMMINEVQGSSTNVLEARGNQAFFGRARLAEGATIVEARAIADRLTMQLREEHPRFWGPDKSFVLVPTEEIIMNPMIDRFVVPAAGMIMAVVGMVLLIACANLASFLLARAADRRREIAVRLALGARRRTLVFQLLTETVLLSAIGGLAGVLVAAQALDALVAADLPLPLPISLDLSLDRTVLGFSVLLSVAAGVLFGLAPALQSTKPDVAPVLRDESAGGGRARGGRLRNALVVGQVATSVVLLVGAGLFLRSLEASRGIDPGFGAGPTALIQVTLQADRYEIEEGYAWLDQLLERVAGLPDVEAVGLIDNMHLNQLTTQSIRVQVEGVDPPPGQDFFSLDYAEIDAGFLETLGIPVVAGRGIEEGDRADAEEVVLVNEEFARRFFPDGDALGRTVLVNDDPHRVVGVTADHKVQRLGEAPTPFVYQSHRQGRSSFVFVVARTRGDDERLALDMLREARALDPQIMISQTITLRRHLATMLFGREMGAFVVGGFALLALLLASIGLYGVVSYAVSRRAREVGIRISLGAEPSSVVRMLTREGMQLVAVGAAIGILASAAVSRLLSRLLFGVPPIDPVTFVTVPTVLAVVALLASWIPARRATRIDPAGALRAD